MASVPVFSFTLFHFAPRHQPNWIQKKLERQGTVTVTINTTTSKKNELWGNRIPGKSLEGIYVTTTPMVQVTEPFFELETGARF